MKLRRFFEFTTLSLTATAGAAGVSACSSEVTDATPHLLNDSPELASSDLQVASLDASTPTTQSALPDGGVDASSPACPADGGIPVVHKLYTQHLGEWLRSQPTHAADFGLLGTDLGIPLRQGTKETFFFGDALASDSTLNNSKTTASITLGTQPDVLSLPKLAFPLGSNGVFTPVSIPGLDFGQLVVPTGAVAVGNKTYVYYASAWDPNQQTQTMSALAHSTGPNLDAMVLDYNVPSTHFIGVQVLEDDDNLLLWGEGPYRKSAVYFATVPKKRIADHSAWRYYTGTDKRGRPAYSASEADAIPVIQSDCVGEFSVVRSSVIGGYVIAYNCFDPDKRGILMQTSPTPTGPWSDPVKILDPQFDAYTTFIHADPGTIGFDDGLADWGREGEFGFEYGPGLVPDWFRQESPGVFSFVYTLSSWNPYTFHLVKTVVGIDGTTASPPPRGVGLPKATLVNGDFGTGDLTGWSQTGAAFVVLPQGNGQNFLTTFNSDGAAATGSISQDFTVDSTTSELIFSVTGGDAVVELLHNGDMVRSTHARESNTTALTAAWNIAEFQGEKVTLVVLDAVTDPWGFINVSPFLLQ